MVFVCAFHSLCCVVSGIGMDHVRVHPKFLHSNATSHKWALGGKLFLCAHVNIAIFSNNS